MSLKIKEFIRYMNLLAPEDLKESYDNVGFQIGDRECEVKKVLIALDATLEVIKEAKEKEVNLLITHHPLLFKKPSSITNDTLQGKKILELIKNDINLYSAHTNLDSVNGGMNDIIMMLLGLKDSEIMDKNINDNSSGIGRIANLDKEKTLKEMCRLVKMNLGVRFIKVVGDMNRSIKTVAVINGSGESFFEKAKSMGADLVITGDTSYHFASDYNEMGMAIMDIGHFSSEWPLFKEISKKIQAYFKENDESIEVFISEKSKDPYSIY
ncbi:dinuclear metal center protein, YbgI/SA1388 family [Clostridium frigidicarnis]|uniref:GTP cyclohydrolase 1 type 2 homolog n=1 Tax=Clostridium frigidicarnis TaxID=84698 RepID=A0A1I0VIX2_9CLOT|nr:dinuclear metal center protein, YbgI/SA1388 family [Clostridium frigidicarnis]